MNAHLTSPWNEHLDYRRRWRALLNAKDTVDADAFLELPGYLPGMRLTAGAASLVHRAAHPCRPQVLLKRRRTCLTFLFNRIWIVERLGVYAGNIRPNDLVIEPMSETLILDCGDPVRCHFTFALSENKLLAATREEFPLEDDFWVERVLFRSRLPEP